MRKYASLCRCQGCRNRETPDAAICAGIKGAEEPNADMCRYAVTWIDADKKQYRVLRVRANKYKIGKRDPAKREEWRTVIGTPAFRTFDAAQTQLNRYAMLREWTVSELPRIKILLTKEYGNSGGGYGCGV